MSHQQNIDKIKVVAEALNKLECSVVFVGGATISLYPDITVFESRPTDDIDVIIEIISKTERSYLEEKLRAIGFTHDIESGIICRYKLEEIIVDIMPTNDGSIGFTNIWYPDGFQNAVDYSVDEYFTIKILSAPYFIATKLEAFKGRGEGDGRTSQDFEDIVFVLENREVIWDEMNNTDEKLKNYLHKEFAQLLDNPNIFEWIDGHVERFSPPATYDIMEDLKKFVS